MRHLIFKKKYIFQEIHHTQKSSIFATKSSAINLLSVLIIYNSSFDDVNRHKIGVYMCPEYKD
jgi:hypothetical protein